MVVKFILTTVDKKDYYEIQRIVNFHRATIVRERVRDLLDEFHCELEVLSHGRSLYRQLKDSGLCKTIQLLTVLEDE
jgi:hypothetical protein